MNPERMTLVLLVAGVAAYSGWLSTKQQSTPTPVIHQPTDQEPERTKKVVPVGEATSVHDLLTHINACVEELYPDYIGSGGNRLRFDSLEIEPYAGEFARNGPRYRPPEPVVTRFRVQIHEEHPHRTVPNGVLFLVTIDGKCQYLAQD